MLSAYFLTYRFAQHNGGNAFEMGTLVACLDENGEVVRRPIENANVGTVTLAYDEETGEKAHKPVVQLFKTKPSGEYGHC